MSEKYAFWVTLRPQSDCCRRGEAEVRILDFKTTWSEFQKANQTATKQGSAERISHQNLSLLTSPESVPSSCVRKHTEVPAQRIVPSYDLLSDLHDELLYIF